MITRAARVGGRGTCCRTRAVVPHGVATLVTATILLLFLCPPSSAQTFGAIGGISISSLEAPSDFAASRQPGVGWSAGAFIGVPFGQSILARAEILFSQNRTTIENVVHDRLTYVGVTALGGFRLPQVVARGLTIHVLGGGAYRSLVAAEESVAGESFDIADGLLPSAIGLVVGGDAALHRRWSAGVRYFHGTTKVYRTLRGDVGSHRDIEFLVTYAVR